MRRLAALTAGLVLAALLASGCAASHETRDAANRLEDALGTPAGTVSVDVRTGVEGVDDEYVETDVVLADDATAEQIADLVVGFPAEAVDAGLGEATDLRRLHLERPGDRSALDIAWKEDVDEQAVLAAARRWLAVTGTFAGSEVATMSSTGPLDWRIHLAAETTTALAAAYDLLRDGPGLVDPEDSWRVETTVGGLVLTLAGDTLPTRHELDVWSQLVDATALLSPEFPPASMAVELLSQRAIVDLTVMAPKGVTEKNLTLDRHAADLQPALRQQLRAVDSLEQPWTYGVSWRSVELPDLSHLMVSLLDREQPIDNHDAASRWSRWAKEYVDSL
jgi:hypothetical protein